MKASTKNFHDNDFNYEKPEITPIKSRQLLYFKRYKTSIFVFLTILVIYVLMLFPLLFLYPNYNKPIKENFDPVWLSNISKKLEGDCFRRTRNFIKACPFPCREVHLSSEHTLVEIEISGTWIAYDPCYNLLFNDQNIVQLSADINRGYIPSYLQNYPYRNALKKFRYYHNLYFVILNITHPFYDKLLRTYYLNISR